MSTEWKVVPVEPTPEMVAAAFHGVIEPQDCLAQQRGRERMAEFYRLMLAASPQPAAQPEQPEPGVLTDAMSPEQVARMFHECYERLAPNFGYETRKETRSFDAHSANGKLMIAVCGLVSRAIAREVLATTRKLSDEQRARIMEAVKLAISNKVSVYEVERLLRGEA